MCKNLFMVLVSIIVAGGCKGGTVLIVDPTHCESGDFCVGVVGPIEGLTVQRVDLGSLSGAAKKKWDAVILVKPDPADYEHQTREQLEALVQGGKTGIVVFGLNAIDGGNTAAFELLGKRSPARQGTHYERYFENCQWIWNVGEPKAKSTVYFRRRFDLAEMPARIGLLISVDDGRKVWINGQEAGGGGTWEQAEYIDLKPHIAVGTNVLCVEATNEGGAAGVIASILGYDNEGRETTAIHSDTSWKCSEIADAKWLEANFDDSDWQKPTELSAIGGGPWARRVRRDDCGLEQILRGQEEQLLGRTVLPDAMVIAAGGAKVLAKAGNVPAVISVEGCGKRTALFAVCPELGQSGEGDVLGSKAFAEMLGDAVRWAAGCASPQKKTVLKQWPLTTHARAKQSMQNANRFPIAMEYGALPWPGVSRAQEQPRSNAGLYQVVDSLVEHGLSLLVAPASVSQEQEKLLEQYAAQRGMRITFNSSGAELFWRDAPPKVCVYSKEYSEAVRQRIRGQLAEISNMPNVYNALLYMDEPFHVGTKSFGYGEEVQAQFKKRYGYALPKDAELIRKDPKQWLDFINFRSDYFPDAWRQVYRIVKEQHPGVEVLLTYDSHNTFGGGVGQESEIAIDDVYHWRADFADTLIFDIYPYMMHDFRYGEHKETPKPRLCQTHYAMAQMRDVSEAYGKKWGFWFGTYNREWFELTPEKRQRYWSEREMMFTAVANGANYLIAGYGIPEDYRHWEELGAGARLLQKAGVRLMDAKRVKARAAMLFPRTQYIQLQEEYWNVGQAFECFARAFGELDMIHEEQISDSKLNGYDILILFNINLLPTEMAEYITEFVKRGGLVIADNVPTLGKYKEHMDVMKKVLGTKPKDGAGFTENRLGKGRAFLLGSILQETDFATWKNNDIEGREELYRKLRSMATSGGVYPHVYSSNPDIEAAVRANTKEGFVVVVSHEPIHAGTVVTLRDLPFEIDTVTDMANDTSMKFQKSNSVVTLQLDVPTGKTYLLNILPKAAK